MSDLERVREWIKGFDGVPHEFSIDYTSEIPGTAGLFPDGMIEIQRREDIVGNVTVTNQYNFGIYYVFSKPSSEDEQAAANAGWVMEFQKWVQEQSILKKAPTFGNFEANKEIFKAQNGTMYSVPETGVAIYMVLLNVTFKNYYGV